MSERIYDKFTQIEEYLEEYNGDRKTKLTCERLFEVIMECIVDAIFIFIEEKKIKTPEDDESAFNKLVDEQIISKELGEKLKDARRMRNILAHRYGVIDNELVFNAVKEQIPRDVREFIEILRRNL